MSEQRIEIRALSWNLFHGRDFPPDPKLLTRRSRLFRISERNATHIQVNRDLLGEFGETISNLDWDVALLQECPPHWAAPLATVCHAEGHRSLTSRNSFAPLRRLLAALNPDLIASGEGGSNLLLVRPGRVGSIAEARELVLQHGPKPERRTMAYARTEGGLCVACLHASTGAARRKDAEREVLAAAGAACDWAGDAPLILGGDFNLRPNQTGAFATLAERFGLEAPTAPGSIDHILCRGLAIAEAPRALDPVARERPHDGRAICLSDHAPVLARFATEAESAVASDERG